MASFLLSSRCATAMACLRLLWHPCPMRRRTTGVDCRDVSSPACVVDIAHRGCVLTCRRWAYAMRTGPMATTSPSPRLHLRKKRSSSTQHAEDAYWPIGLSTLQRPSRPTSSHPRQISLQQRPTTARPSGPDWRRNTEHASTRAGDCGFFVGCVCIGCARTSACLRTHAVRNGECQGWCQLTPIADERNRSASCTWRRGQSLVTCRQCRLGFADARRGGPRCLRRRRPLCACPAQTLACLQAD